jgi:galactose mutarotase-like enzyme
MPQSATTPPCQVTERTLAGWRALELSNESLSVTVLPEKGADIASIRERTGVDLLLRSPSGLGPSGTIRPEAGDAEFLHNYEGGWQTLFPNIGASGVHRGRPIPFHGEVALRSWDYVIVQARGEAVEVRLRLECETGSFAYERAMRMRRGDPALIIEERVVNVGDEPAEFVWGHHCVLGRPFLTRGCRLRAPAHTVVTLAQEWEDTARLELGQRAAWPFAHGADGGLVDLRDVPGPEEGTHDDVFLTDLEAGWIEVENPHLGFGFRLEFDAEVFPWVCCWMPYGGARDPALRGIYGLGVEPFTSPLSLERAVAAGEACTLAPGNALETTLRASIVRASRHGDEIG